MGSGCGSWVNALRALRRARVYPDLLGLLQRVRAFFLRVSFVRGGISVAAGRTSGRDLGTRAQHCVGARHLLCSRHSFELGIRLHHPHRFLNPDYSVFDCGGVALSEDKLSFSWEGDRSGLGRVVGHTYPIRFLPVGPSSSRNRRQVPTELPISRILTSSLRWGIAAIRTGTEKASLPSHSRAASSATLNIY